LIQTARIAEPADQAPRRKAEQATGAASQGGARFAWSPPGSPLADRRTPRTPVVDGHVRTDLIKIKTEPVLERENIAIQKDRLRQRQGRQANTIPSKAARRIAGQKACWSANPVSAALGLA